MSDPDAIVSRGEMQVVPVPAESLIEGHHVPDMRNRLIIEPGNITMITPARVLNHLRPC